MTSEIVLGIEEARGRLGDLITAAQQGASITITRNGKPAAYLHPHPFDEPMFTYADMVIGFEATPDRVRQVASWAGAFDDLATWRRTGRIPNPWTGQGTEFQFTRMQYDQLCADWSSDAQRANFTAADLGDSESIDIARRYDLHRPRRC